MDFSTTLKGLVGFTTVVEENGIITVKNIPTKLISYHIAKLWSTSKINTHMFTKMDSRGFSFPSFFAVEVRYMLKQLLEQPIGGWSTKRTINRIIELLEENTWLKSTRDQNPQLLNFARLNDLKRKALPLQLQFLENYNKYVPQFNLKGYILSATPGSGKTFTNLMLGRCLEVDHHIIVSPRNAIYDVWKREILDWVKDATVWIEADKVPYKGEQYLVCHYEALDKMLAVVSRNHLGKVMVTLDESHNLNELTSQRTQLFIQLCKEVNGQHVVWSSGTPLKALGYEIIPILRTIDPLFTPLAEERFRNIFGRNANRGLDILNHRIGLISYKVTKNQIRDKEPQRFDVKVKIPNGKDYTISAIKVRMQQYIDKQINVYMAQMSEHVKFYEMIIDDIDRQITSPQERQDLATYRQYIRAIRRGFDPVTMGHMATFCNNFEDKSIIPRLRDPATREKFKKTRSIVKYVHLKVLGEALGNVLGKARVECHVEMVKHVDFDALIEQSDSKTLIFTSYVQVLNEVVERLSGDGYGLAVVYGKTNKDLEAILNEFKKNPDVNPLVATYKSLYAAVPLTEASTTIFIDQPFRDYIKHQAESRTDRLGQPFTPRFFNLILDTGTEPNISTRANDILEWSKAQVAAIMGDEGSAVEIDSVDKYYESNESMLLHPDLVRFEAALESLIKERD